VISAVREVQKPDPGTGERPIGGFGCQAPEVAAAKLITLQSSV
jgi:hypothetical protein